MIHDNSEIAVMKQQGNNYMVGGDHNIKNYIKGT